MAVLARFLFASATLLAVAAAYDKCYNEGERCIGAANFPAVPYRPCCDGMECSVKDTSYGGYGLLCAKKGYAPVKEEPKCYKEGERCIGAANFPAVPYRPCCKGMKCSAKDTTYGGYGLVCAKADYSPSPKKGYPPVKEGPKCYKAGERCIGAAGFPAVPYLPCCDGDCTAKDTSYGGYGLVCAAKGYAPVKEEPKCYKEGERCIGAANFPAVAYRPCCDGMECSAKDTSYGGYGLLCAKKGYKPVKEEPKCIKAGEQCKKGYGPKCCGYNKCVQGYGKYAFVCGPEATLPPTTTAPKCIKAGEQCKKGYGPKCCGYNKCVQGYGNYEFVCGPEATTPPPTTTPKCLGEGKKCGSGYDACCADTECKSVQKYGYDARCVKKNY